MVVKDFIRVEDAKMTFEKEVKPKLSLKELTKVESPGTKKVDIENGEGEKENGKLRKRRVGKKEIMLSEERVKEVTKKDSIFIITEKPQAAQKIADALGNPSKYTEDGVSYYELEYGGKKIIVASAVGHLLNLTYKKGQKGWPIFEVEWVPAFVSKSSWYTKKYYNLIKKLSKRAKEYFIATDFDIEGEVIGWNILRFICNVKNAKRMKFSTLTSEELKKSFDSPLPQMAWGNAYAGEARHILDWLYGINLSRALMSAIKTTGSFRILSIGRVQGPALKIIVDREKEIQSFKSEPYWQVFAESNGVTFKHPEDIFDKKELAKFKNIKEADAETKESDEKVEPPVPFDLTTLQKEAYKILKLNPSETLRIAQQLYLDGAISYPRTSSQKLPEEIKPKKILDKLGKSFSEVKFASRQKPIEGSKSDLAHPSIYPTGEVSKVNEKNEKLYNLIVKRFISLFCSDLKTKNKRIVLDAKGVKFTANGQKVIEKGWTQVYPYKTEEMDLPDMKGKVKIDKIDIVEKETQPPNRYTPASLISILEKKNLGTKATRSSIVDTLFDRGYLEGNSIKATSLGMHLIDSLERHSPIIIDENLTRQLEEEMEKLQDSDSDLEKKEQEVIEKAKRLILDISKEFKSKENEIGKSILLGIQEFRQEQQTLNTLQKCPSCNKGDLRILFNRGARRYFVACSNYPECKHTYSLPPNALIKKAETQCEADKFPKLLAIRKGKRPWEFCFNPECPIEKEKREKWAIKTSPEK